MVNAPAGIFISYRRQEANYLAGWLHDCLADHFGAPRVFLDIDWIKPGTDFMRVIAEAIARSGVMLVIIGPQWVSTNRNGQRRLEEPNDPVRVELETAFQRGIRVVPLLLDGASMPRPEELPDGVARLTRFNALRVGYESFRTDVGRLVATIAEVLGMGGSPRFDTADVEVGPEAHPRPTKVVRAAPVDAQRDQEQLTRLLSRLSRTYTEYLNQSVEHDSILKLELDLDRLPHKTFRPQDRLLTVSERPAEPLPAGTSLLQAFDESGGLDGDGLLVLGEPGAGKTTLLFELARRLAERAQPDPRHPTPVYVPLSGWATHRPPLGQWLVDQLAELYQIPRALGHRWTHDAQLLFLLDGLDEIPDRRDRAACVKAINQFNRFGRSDRLPMVVASRPVEYDMLPVKLQLETAIGVRPLDPTVVLGCLRQAGPNMGAAVAVLQRDPELLELLRSPLLVSMLTLAYAGIPEADVHAATGGTPAERRHQLITDYVNRRFELDRLGADPNPQRRNAYPPERTRAWLSALARNLIRDQQAVFLLGRLPLDWLPTRWARRTVICAPGLIYGLGVALIVGLSAGLNSGVGVGLIDGLIVGLSVGLGVGLGVGLIGQPHPTERLSWSWKRARAQWRTALIVGLIVGLIAGLIVGPDVGLDAGLDAGLGVGLGVGLIGGLSGLDAGVGVGLGVGLIIGLSVGALYGLGIGLSIGWGVGWAVGLGVGLAVGLSAGLGAGLVGQPHPTERLSWSWKRARAQWRTALIVGLCIGWGVGLLFGFAPVTSGRPTELGVALRHGLIAGLITGSIPALAVGLVGGLSRSLIPLYVTPNEGIRKSARNGLVVTLAVGLIPGLIAGLSVGLIDEPTTGLVIGLGVVLVFGLPAGLTHGLGGAAQHGVLRLLLYKYHVAPLRYVRWLNHTVHLRLLYRSTSGGYVFIHRIVQDYFSNLLNK